MTGHPKTLLTHWHNRFTQGCIMRKILYQSNTINRLTFSNAQFGVRFGVDIFAICDYQKSNRASHASASACAPGGTFLSTLWAGW